MKKKVQKQLKNISGYKENFRTLRISTESFFILTEAPQLHIFMGRKHVVL